MPIAHHQIRRRHDSWSPVEWKDGRLLSSGADRKLAVRYHDLLVETMLFCINKLAKTGAYTALMEFSSKVLGALPITLRSPPPRTHTAH
jgi:hypothetical protein